MPNQLPFPRPIDLLKSQSQDRFKDFQHLCNDVRKGKVFTDKLLVNCKFTLQQDTSVVLIVPGIKGSINLFYNNNSSSSSGGELVNLRTYASHPSMCLLTGFGTLQFSQFCQFRLGKGSQFGLQIAQELGHFGGFLGHLVFQPE